MKKNTLCSLSKTEVELTARLSYEEKEIVTAKELDSYLPAHFPYRSQLVYSLKKKHILIPIKNGIYIFVPLGSVTTGRRISEFLIPPLFFPKDNYYIGYSTMFNYYNFTEQQFQTIYVLNTQISREKMIAGLMFKFIKISPKKIYGLKTIKIKGKNVIISSKERTLIDLIDYNSPVGGIKEASDILKKMIQEKKCSIKKLIGYAIKFPKIKTRKQIGIILEQAGVDVALLRPLEKNVQKTSLISFTHNRRGSINEKWRAIVAHTPE